MSLQRQDIHDSDLISAVAHVSDAGPAVTDFDTDLAEPTNAHYNGLLCVFLNGVCQGQAHLVDEYTGANGNLAFVAGDQWTDAPADGDRFILIPADGVFAKMIYERLGAPAGASIAADLAALEDKLDTGGLGVGLVIKALTFANDTGQVALFTVTGDVIVRIVAIVKTTCATGTACNISVGIAALVDAIIPVTDITDLVIAEIWWDTAPDSVIEALGTMREHIISDGNDITLNSSAADNSGAITFYCFWIALSAGASVVAA